MCGGFNSDLPNCIDSMFIDKECVDKTWETKLTSDLKYGTTLTFLLCAYAWSIGDVHLAAISASEATSNSPFVALETLKSQ
jgi:hypothetical protein